jgi:hypothetical protein
VLAIIEKLIGELPSVPAKIIGPAEVSSISDSENLQEFCSKIDLEYCGRVNLLIQRIIML